MIAPDPPRIDCSERAAPESLPAESVPVFPAPPALDAGGPAWASYVGVVHQRWAALLLPAYGAYESIVTQRVATADCLDRERAAGRIR